MLALTSHVRVRRNAAAVVVAIVGLLAVGVVADAATYDFSGVVPRFGSMTYTADDFYTTNDVSGIRFRYIENPYSSGVKAVRCSNGANLGGYVSFSADYHDYKLLVPESDVATGVCFNINIDSATTNYWGFTARIQA